MGEQCLYLIVQQAVRPYRYYSIHSIIGLVLYYKLICVLYHLLWCFGPSYASLKVMQLRPYMISYLAHTADSAAFNAPHSQQWQQNFSWCVIVWWYHNNVKFRQHWWGIPTYILAAASLVVWTYIGILLYNNWVLNHSCCYSSFVHGFCLG